MGVERRVEERMALSHLQKIHPFLAEYIADALEELWDKTEQWTWRLTEIDQLTMHTAMSSKDM